MPLSGNLRSITFMLCTVAMFSCMDAMLKMLSGDYPAAQVTAMRGWASLPLVCIYIAWRREFHHVFSARLRWRLHALRAVFGIMTMVLFVAGIKTMGLAEAYTLTFISPMVITLLAVPMLQERVQARHWFAIAAGLVGIVIALRPDHSGFLTVGALAVLGAAVTYAVGSVLGRIISRTDPAVSLVFWSTASLAVGGSLLNWGHWVGVRPEHWLALLGIAITGFLAQVSITEAFRHGQASAVAPFEYSALAWAVALDWLFWRSVPDTYTLAGASIIIASGVYLIRREAPGRVPVVMPP
jgi:drug/metabolite transporter (DMT)-like permease